MSSSCDIAALTLYLAGPMRGVPLYNFPAFAAGRAALRGLGARVICPAEMDLELGFDPERPAAQQGFDEEAALRRDLEALTSADGVAFLPGSRHSAGAQAEYEMARALGLRMFTVHSSAVCARGERPASLWLREESPAEMARLMGGAAPE